MRSKKRSKQDFFVFSKKNNFFFASMKRMLYFCNVLNIKSV